MNKNKSIKIYKKQLERAAADLLEHSNFNGAEYDIHLAKYQKAKAVYEACQVLLNSTDTSYWRENNLERDDNDALEKAFGIIKDE